MKTETLITFIGKSVANAVSEEELGIYIHMEATLLRKKREAAEVSRTSNLILWVLEECLELFTGMNILGNFLLFQPFLMDRDKKIPNKNP